MQLTSTSFIVVLIIMAIAMIGVTVWLMPKVSGRGLKQVLARLGLLTACQLAIVLALSAGINAYFIFYTTWGDLLGTDNAGAEIGGGRVPGGQVAKALPRKISPHGAGLGFRKPDRDGQLEQVTINGATTGLRSDGYVYLPPQYFQPQFSKQRFPIVVMLTGYPGHPNNLIDRQEVPKLAMQDIKSGKVPPTVYAFLQATVAPPRDTECTNVPGGPQVESFFAQDVPTSLSSTYRLATTARGWGVMGQSTGGYCAAKLAMMHSDRFSAAGMLSPHFRAPKDGTTGDLYGGSKAVRNDNDMIWRLEHLPPPPVAMLIAGTKKETAHAQQSKFASLIRPPAQVVTAFLPDGGHNMRTFRRLTPVVLRFLGRQLRVE